MTRRNSFPLWTIPAALLIVVGVAYGLFTTQSGIHWDDWAMMWIPAFLGKEGVIQYFASSRPVWGYFYVFNTSWIGTNILGWQMFALIWRWLAAVACMVGASSVVAEEIPRRIFHDAVDCFVSRLHGTFHRHHLRTFFADLHILFSFHRFDACRRTLSALFIGLR